MVRDTVSRPEHLSLTRLYAYCLVAQVCVNLASAVALWTDFVVCIATSSSSLRIVSVIHEQRTQPGPGLGVGSNLSLSTVSDESNKHHYH